MLCFGHGTSEGILNSGRQGAMLTARPIGPAFAGINELVKTGRYSMSFMPFEFYEVSKLKLVCLNYAPMHISYVKFMAFQQYL